LDILELYGPLLMPDEDWKVTIGDEDAGLADPW
jgi:hypothetical protein